MTSGLPEAAGRYVPPGADLGDESIVAGLFDELQARPIRSGEDLERWILDAEELRAAIEEAGAVRQVRVAQRTSDEAARVEYERFIEGVRELATRRSKDLDQRFLGAGVRRDLDRGRWFVYDREVETREAIYRDENVPLGTTIDKEVQEYDRVVGAMTVDWDGEETTLPRMAVHLQDPDRATRERAWLSVAERRRASVDALDDLFDRLVSLRRRVAANAGFADFQRYRFQELGRFDYSPEDCRRFREAVERVFVPVRARVNEDRRRRLGVETLRPWDLAVDVEGKAPLAPFREVEALVAGCRSIFERIDPDLGRDFETMRAGGLLDLENRKDKAPGGFQVDFPLRRVPFIFMNAAGLDHDVRTLLHEGGHAFHTLACANEPVWAYRKAPIEFSEVASMAMELLATPHLGVFYGEDDRRRSIEDHLRHVLDIFVMTATGDAFQDWLYARPEHTRAERTATWLELQDRFEPGLDWSGLEDVRTVGWQRILHFFHVPFYYIEYAFAQIGGLQIWLRSEKDPAGAVADYRRALALGGSRPLPELFAAAGARFAFDEATLRPLADRIEAALLGDA